MEKYFGWQFVFEVGKQVRVDLGSNLLDAILKARELGIPFVCDSEDKVVAGFLDINVH
jgi:pheromone shutdown protein TraB